jgi:hypothetical protein
VTGDVAALVAAGVGNRVVARAARGLMRQHPPDGPAPAAPPAAPAAPGRAPAPGLSSDAQKRLIYAQTVLGKLEKLPEGDRATLDKAAAGSTIMKQIERRDHLRSDLEKAKIDLESAKDVSGADKPAKEEEAQKRVETLTLDLEGAEQQVKDGLKDLGVASEAELVQLVDEKFPGIWEARAKAIANAMLDENLKVVEEEERRYDYMRGGAPKTAYDDINALRLADRELGAFAAKLESWGDPYARANYETVSKAVGKGPESTPQGAADPYGDTGAESAERHSEKTRMVTRWQTLGMQHVLLLHQEYVPGSLDKSGDDDLLKLTGEYTKHTKENIQSTRENIADGTLSLLDLRDVPDLAFQELHVERDSMLAQAVDKKFAKAHAEEEALRAALDALALTVTLVATAAAGPVGAAIGALAQGAVGIYGLSKDIAKQTAIMDAQQVALDPALAKISAEEPDLFALIVDVVMLGVEIKVAAGAAAELRTALRELRQTKDAAKFTAVAKRIVGDEEKARILAGKAMRDREFPTGFMEVHPDYRSAQKAYLKALEDDPSKEVGIWKNEKTGKYVVGYGNPSEVEGPALWTLMKHHHPGSPVAARAKDRLPSKEDFLNMMSPQIEEVKPREVRSMITWYDEDMRMHYTTFGMDPNKLERYWVRYTGPDGRVASKSFIHDPWGPGKDEYFKWTEQVESEFIGPSTNRP